jgi:hypothetical protein
MKTLLNIILILFSPTFILAQLNNTKLKSEISNKFSIINPNSKLKPLNKSERQNKVNNYLLNSFKYNGKVVTYVGTSNEVSSNRKTIRNGRTTVVMVDDGSSGTNEKIGNTSTSKTQTEVCNTTQVTLEAGFNELNILDQQAVEIWPGRIINISTMDEGAYETFTNYTRRNDLRVAVINSGTSSGSVFRQIKGSNISQGTVRDAYNDILRNFGSNSFGSQTVMMEIIEYFNDEQFSIEAGLGIQAPALQLNLGASSGVRKNAKKNKIILKFLRDAYTVKVDNDINQLVEAENLSNDAGIIVSVNYGSWGIVQVESDSSYSSMISTLNAAFQADPTTSVTSNMNAEQKNTATSMSIKGIFKGVDGNNSLRNFANLDQVREITTNNKDYTATSPVVPISFSIKSIKTGQTMMLRSTMTYPRPECKPISSNDGPKNVRVKLIAFSCPKVSDGFSSDEDIFGNIDIAFNENGNKKSIRAWEASTNNNVKVGESHAPNGARGEKAYSLEGAPSVKDVTFKIDGSDPNLETKMLEVTLNLKDEEWGGPYEYESRTYKIKYSHILLLLSRPKGESAPQPTPLYHRTHGMYMLETIEKQKDNKIVLWLQIEPN